MKKEIQKSGTEGGRELRGEGEKAEVCGWKAERLGKSPLKKLEEGQEKIRTRKKMNRA